MTSIWHSADEPRLPPVALRDAPRLVIRLIVLAALVFGGLFLLLLLRLIERPLHGMHRPWTPHITQFVCANALRIMGLKLSVIGRQMKGAGAVVANHSSWLDIFVLNARQRVYFVSKSEVATWPGIGWLARATGTVFITRDRREAAAQKQLFEARLDAGHRLLFFPEGTSTDNQRVLPFKSTLFAAFMDKARTRELHIQPVTVIYNAPDGADPRFYGWWGDMDFGPHFLMLLASGSRGSIDLIYHKALRVNDYSDRKVLARDCEEMIRAALPSRV